MDVILRCCAGLDVHKDSVEACVRLMSAGAKVEHEVRHWGTTTRELEAMAAWLAAAGVTQVAMESTGVYSKPVFNILEAQFEDSYFQAHARNRMRRRGRKRGLVAVAHSQLTVLDHMLKENAAYRDLGPQFPDRTRAAHLLRYHVSRLQNLGMEVTLTPQAG